MLVEDATHAAVEAAVLWRHVKKQDQQPQSTIALLASCHKWTCSCDLEDQKVYSPLCFRPYFKWAL